MRLRRKPLRLPILILLLLIVIEAVWWWHHSRCCCHSRQGLRVDVECMIATSESRKVQVHLKLRGHMILLI